MSPQFDTPHLSICPGRKGVSKGTIRERQTDQSGGNKNQRAKKVRGHVTRWRRPRCPLFDRYRSLAIIEEGVPPHFSPYHHLVPRKRKS
ncbi:hypothetical protein TNCV_4615911 [Trichonephila clavipes]|nr:hypothetical protein TNCV_4615911 [Trichonephila clavipes]